MKFVFEWLLAPIDPSRGHALSDAVAWHGRLMVLAWCVLLPAGVMMARFWKLAPGQKWPEEADNKLWWRAHLMLQYSGGLAVAGAMTLVGLGGALPRGVHTRLGWCVAGLLAAQFISGWLRGTKGGPAAAATGGSPRGDHYDMTSRRRLFERTHKAAGYIALATAIAAVASGLWLANAPRWMWLAVGVWWIALSGVAFVWQRQGRAIDTYQAIWGPDLSHPGNSRKPIGWGVRRRNGGQPQ